MRNDLGILKEMNEGRRQKMIQFWISFLLLALSWIGATIYAGIEEQTIFLSVAFFSLYFLLPLFSIRVKQGILLLLPAFPLVFIFGQAQNPFSWLIYLVLLMYAPTYFKGKSFYAYMALLTLYLVAPILIYEESQAVYFLLLLISITLVYVYHWKEAVGKEKQLKQQYETILNEYRLVKRQISDNEEIARQEERNEIAREIHDSVGHRLTALVMQMEVTRLQAEDEKTKQKIMELKQLAQSSLQDTREAVKALKSEETVGLQAVIQLIRKLEAESHLRVSIHLHSGVLGVVLSNQQSVAVYRAVQESLTNMMRHSGTRQAEVSFEWVAQRDFRFQVSHHIQQTVKIKEGFGLSTMRERLEDLDGRLTTMQHNGKLTVLGQFPLISDRMRGKNND